VDYQEFRDRIGKFTVPTKELIPKLIEGLDSIHFVAALGAIKGDKYEINISSEMMQCFCEIIELIEKRGAVRGRDYIIGGEKLPYTLTIGIHTTHAFLSDEDLDVSIRRYYSK